MILAQWSGVSREGMDGMSGAPFPFSLRTSFIFLNQDNSIVTCFLDVAGLSDSQLSIDRGIGASFSMLVFL